MSNSTINVVGKRIIARENELEPEKKSNLIIMTQTKPSEVVLEVVSVGDDIPIYPGQQILVKNGWMYKFKHNDEDLVLITLDDVIGIINEKS
jgi:co-chaperonin GroES (HSP10)